MIKETTYHPEWQKNRINFILSLYPKDFFVGKRVLELGAYNGYIGAYFSQLGADVYCLEGREENINSIKSDYPFLNVEQADLDTDVWKWGKWDIIINFGLYYHLEKYHKEHLINCINNCDLMFFETVVFDSKNPEIFINKEKGKDQSLSNIGGYPSTAFIENILKSLNVSFIKHNNKQINGDKHHYDWEDKDSKKLDHFARRFWIINNNLNEI